MNETSTGGIVDESTSPWAGNSLFVLCGIYTPLGGGRFLYYGERPGDNWYGHGYFPKGLTILRGGRPEKIELYKHRWKDRKTGVTVHSSPPDDPRYVRCCSLIVVLRIWTFISSSKGIHNRGYRWVPLADPMNTSPGKRIVGSSIRIDETLPNGFGW
jgi:hypothetical protein